MGERNGILLTLRFHTDALRACRLGKPPFAQVDLSTASITSEQIYDVVLEVVAPASPNNVQLGTHHGLHLM